MVGEDLKWHSHEIWPEFGYRPNDGQALLSPVEGPRSAADGALFAIADLSQDRTEACSRCVGI